MAGKLIIVPGTSLECAHRKPIRQCAKCSREGELYERDSEIIKAAEGLSPAEWARRGRLFMREALRLRRIHGRGSKPHRAARTAAKQCFDLAKVLAEIAIRRGLQDAPRASVLHQGGMDPSTGEIVDEGEAAAPPPSREKNRRQILDAARDHEDSARRLRASLGANHPDTQRHRREAKILRRLAKKARS